MAPVDLASHIEIQPTEASRRRFRYQIANGGRVRNVGQKQIRGLTSDGFPIGMTWQVADVKRPLASIGRMCDAGNTAVFTSRGGYVVPENKMRNALDMLEIMEQCSLRSRIAGGVYGFDIWAPKDKGSSSSSREARESGF